MLILEFNYPSRDPFAFRKVMGDVQSIWSLWWELKTCTNEGTLSIKIKNLDGETLDLTKGSGINDFHSFDTPFSYG